MPKVTCIRRGIALRGYPPSSYLESGVAVTDHWNRYFCNPNFQSHIEVLPGTYAAEEEKKYPGINSGQYLVQRLATTY